MILLNPKKYDREHYLLHKERILERNRTAAEELKILVFSHYSTSDVPRCARCGIDDIDVLCLDHINGGGNKWRCQNGNKVNWQSRYNEKI